MVKSTIVFLILLTIILFPIPFKITLKYSNKILDIYIYNKNLSKKLSKKTLCNKELKRKLNNKFLQSLTFRDVRLIFYKIKNMKLKPSLKLNTKIDYGFEDAALVGILFGLIHSTYSFIYIFLMNFAKVKTIDLKVNPHFKENEFNMEILSIISMSLAKIIYIGFIMTITIIKIKHNKRNKGGNLHG